jgi:hypothetical protein
MQATIDSLCGAEGIGVSNPWTEYVKMLPSNVPVPTRWTEDQRALLAGTSLEVGLVRVSYMCYFLVEVCDEAPLSPASNCYDIQLLGSFWPIRVDSCHRRL